MLTVVPLMAAIATVSAPAPGLEDDGAAIVATVDGAPIVRRDVEAALRAARIDVLASPERALQARAAVLERLVEDKLLEFAIAKAGITVVPADIDTALLQAQNQVAAQGQQFADFLARTGRTEAEFRKTLQLEVAAKKLVEPRATTAALAAFVEATRREHDGTLLRDSHVLQRPDVGTGDEAIASYIERADRIRREILAGDVSFAMATEKYSAAPSRRNGGDVGFLPRHSAAHEEFARQVFTLAKGEVSRPFATPFGVHLVTVTEVQPGRESAAALTEKLRPLFVLKLIRDAVSEQRKLREIEYAAGVPHFDPATPHGGPLPRRIVVKGANSP